MWERFCILAQSECHDGIVKSSALACCHWNSIEDECSLATGMRLGCEQYRKSINTPSFGSMISKMMEQKAINEKLTKAEAKAKEFGLGILKKSQGNGESS